MCTPIITLFDFGKFDFSTQTCCNKHHKVVLSLVVFTYPALKVHLSTERDQGLNTFHLSNAVVALPNQLKPRLIKEESQIIFSSRKKHCIHK